MKKQALLAMLLVLTMLLTGCSLVTKDAAVDAATEIIKFGDKVITKGEVNQQVDSYLEQLAYYYSMYGYSIDKTDKAVIEDARNSVVENIKTSLVSEAKIAELGLDQLTEEEAASLKEAVQSEMTAYTDSVKSAYFSETELEGDALTEAINAKLAELGITEEALNEYQKSTLLASKLREYIIKDVTVSDEEIKADYESKVEADKTSYEANANAFVSAVNAGTKTYFAPENVRMVKQILIKYTAEDQAKIDEINSQITAAQAEEGKEEEVKTLQAQLEETRKAALANLDATADEILAQLVEGADFDTLMAEKGEDPGMKSGTTAQNGYAVCEGMTSFDPAFVAAAMGLEKIGDVSAKTVGETYGYYIIKYVSDVTPGEIGLDAVKDSIQSALLTSKQNTTNDETIEQWVKEATFKLDLKALED